MRAKFKLKINNRPDKEDFQAVPKSLQNLIKAKEEIKAGTYNQYPNKKVKQPKDDDHKGLLDSTKHTTFEGPKLKGMSKPLKPIPVFKQKPDLSESIPESSEDNLQMPHAIQEWIPRGYH